MGFLDFLFKPDEEQKTTVTEEKTTVTTNPNANGAENVTTTSNTANIISKPANMGASITGGKRKNRKSKNRKSRKSRKSRSRR